MRKESKIIFIITLCKKKKVRDFPSSSACSKLIILWNLDLVQNRAKFPFEFFFHKLSKCLVSTHLENNYLLLFFSKIHFCLWEFYLCFERHALRAAIFEKHWPLWFLWWNGWTVCFAGRNIFRKTVLFLYNIPYSIGIPIGH